MKILKQFPLPLILMIYNLSTETSKLTSSCFALMFQDVFNAKENKDEDSQESENEDSEAEEDENLEELRRIMTDGLK